VAVETVGADGLEMRLARYAGDVVLVDFWATWCVPCLEAFPELCRLQEEYGDEGLILLAVSIDLPKVLETKVKPFLAKQPCRPETVLLDPDELDTIVDRWGDRWRSEVPARFLFNRNGNLIDEFLADVPPSEIEAAVRKALGPMGEAIPPSQTGAGGVSSAPEPQPPRP
jgi:thiol-disulfide isomerase/thioredoxin